MQTLQRGGEGESGGLLPSVYKIKNQLIISLLDCIFISGELNQGIIAQRLEYCPSWPMRAMRYFGSHFHHGVPVGKQEGEEWCGPSHLFCGSEDTSRGGGRGGKELPPSVYEVGG